MGFVCFVKWKIPLGSTTFHWIPNKPTLSKSVGGDIVWVRVPLPAPKEQRPHPGPLFLYFRNEKARTRSVCGLSVSVVFGSAGDHFTFIMAPESTALQPAITMAVAVTPSRLSRPVTFT